MINRVAAENLPADVPAFLRNGNALDVLGWLAPEADRWREGARGELVGAPDHFIDMEWAELAEVPCSAGAADCPPSGKMLPPRRYDFIRALAAAQAKNPGVPLTAEKVGLLPWQTAEIYERLRVDFRQYRQLVEANGDLAPVETAILYDAGWLGHFAGDGSQPLHTTIQYNGWTGPNPNGYTTEHKIHSEFESAYVGANIKPADFAPLVKAAAPVKIDDEWTQYLDYLQHSNTMVEKVYELEKAGGFTGAGTAEAKAFTDERLAAGAIELRDLIYSAWVHSADPVEVYHGPQ
ncbi:MAG TPA: nuclease [Acidobacteriaceae bacterium]|nr:nuclease [Acidobacteriaceae bacterium]